MPQAGKAQELAVTSLIAQVAQARQNEARTRQQLRQVQTAYDAMCRRKGGPETIGLSAAPAAPLVDGMELAQALLIHRGGTALIDHSITTVAGLRAVILDAFGRSADDGDAGGKDVGAARSAPEHNAPQQAMATTSPAVTAPNAALIANVAKETAGERQADETAHDGPRRVQWNNERPPAVKEEPAVKETRPTAAEANPHPSPNPNPHRKSSPNGAKQKRPNAAETAATAEASAQAAARAAAKAATTTQVAPGVHPDHHTHTHIHTHTHTTDRPTTTHTQRGSATAPAPG